MTTSSSLDGTTAAARRPSGDIAALTSLRGVLAVWVMLYHFWTDVIRLFPALDAWSPLIRMGHLAVPAFFLLSGFVLAYNYGDRFPRLHRADVVRFLGLRLARIYPVHLFTLFVVLAMVSVSRRLGYAVDEAGYSPRDFWLNVFLVQTWVPDFRLNWNYPSWSISSEWFAYLLFPPAVAYGLRHLTTPRRAMIAMLVTLAASIVVMVAWPPRPFYELALVVPTFFCGAAGYWVIRHRLSTDNSRLPTWLPEALWVVIGLACFQLAYPFAVSVLLASFLGLILSLARLGPRCHRFWAAAPTVFLGEVSYSLYMTHTLAHRVTTRLLPAARFEAASAITKLAILATSAALVIIACLATYWLVEAPCRRYFKRALRAKSAATGHDGLATETA